MTKQTMKYNPAFLTAAELVDQFVVRRGDLESVLRTVRDNTASANQHVLIIGPRGSGKTMLVRRVAAEIGRDPELSERWYPVIFAEESYQVTTPGEFWLEALLHLGRQTKDRRWQEKHDEYGKHWHDEDAMRERALGQLMAFAEKENKRILLVVENFNALLGDQLSDDDAWKLRHTLQNEPRIMLLATATSRFEQISNPNKAMYELFHQHHLHPLGRDECRVLWESLTGQQLEGDRVRPIEILTGGNARLLTILSVFGAKRSLRRLMNDLVRLVDEHTEYFKSHLDALPPTERKVYLALVERWDPSTARDVADAARLSVNQASSLLRRLVDRGAVVTLPDTGRTKSYQVAERMYNIYYLFRRRGAAAERVRAVVRFMVNFYHPEELLAAARGIVAEACEIGPTERQDHYSFFCDLADQVSDDSVRNGLIELARDRFAKMHDLPDRLAQMIRPRRESMESCAEPSGTATPLQAFFDQIDLFVRESRFKEAENVCRQMIEANPESAMAWTQLGEVLHEHLSRYDEAEGAYRKAIDINPRYAWPWSQLGQLFHEKLSRYQEAEEAYRRAIELEPKAAWGWIKLGELLHKKLSRFDEAEGAYRRAIEINPQSVWPWGRLGELLHEKLSRFDEAEEAYRKAIELEPGVARGWFKLGELLHEKLSRYDEAEEAYRRAIDINPQHDPPWGRLGQLLHEKLSRFDEAEEAYRKAIEINPQYAWAWYHLGKLLHEKSFRYDEAEEAYRKAIKFEPEVALGWGRLGELLHEELSRFDEAEEAYRKAIELLPELGWAWCPLGKLLHEKLSRYDEAEEAYRKAIELEPEAAWPWYQLGKLLHEKLSRYDEAEKAYRKVVEIEPLESDAWSVLFRLLVAQPQRHQEAIQLADTALATLSDNARLLNSFAWTLCEIGSDATLDRALDWARQAVELKPDIGEFVHTLARVQCRAGLCHEALKSAEKYLADEESVARTVNDAVELFVELAARGEAAKALQILTDSPSRKHLEPLEVGIRIFLKQDVRVAVEIHEVGIDVARRIQSRREALESK